MNNFLFSNRFQNSLRFAMLLAMLMVSLGPGGAMTVYAAPPSNDEFASATVVTTIPLMQTYSTVEATEQTGEPTVPVACEGRILLTGQKTVWYRFAPGGTSRSISVDTIGSDYDTYLAIWRGTNINNLTFIGCDDDTVFDLGSQIAFTAQAGSTYYIQVAAYAGVPGNPESPTGGNLEFHITNFTDVASNHWAWRYVEGLAGSGVTAGCSVIPSRYCPTVGITRDQMAVFLLKAIHGSSYVPPDATGVYDDVDPNTHWAADWIEQLAAEQITAGCSITPSRYCPSGPVTRDQMAVFLLKAKHGAAYTPPPATGVFSDVNPTTHWAAAWIEQLAAEGITSGCGGGSFCPSQQVTRDQMAVFLVKTFSIPLLP